MHELSETPAGGSIPSPYLPMPRTCTHNKVQRNAAAAVERPNQRTLGNLKRLIELPWTEAASAWIIAYQKQYFIWHPAAMLARSLGLIPPLKKLQSLEVSRPNHVTTHQTAPPHSPHRTCCTSRNMDTQNERHTEDQQEPEKLKKAKKTPTPRKLISIACTNFFSVTEINF